MSALQDAKVHLAKAREFLAAAEVNHDRELYNAATSDAVISGINSKDAIRLVLTGRSSKGEDHKVAVPELKGAGRAVADLASTLSRLLRLKTKAQYTSTSVSASDAVKAVELAKRLLAGAEDVSAGR